MNRRKTPYSIEEATKESPTLAKLIDLSRESNAMLQSIQPFIPSTLRPAIKAGPVDGTTWCLIVEGNAAVAKLRQLLPRFQAHLLSTGKQITDIRLKVHLAKKNI
ncbi:MAG: hypothetical protein RIS97_990 [Pseudomonadota bacterium]|jgi:hypothetical protein